MNAHPYLNFTGQCEQAFKFYAELMGGTIEMMMPYEGSPAAAHAPKDWQKAILHARLRIGDTVIMASDAPPGRQRPMHGFAIALDVNSSAEAERVFKALAEGGTIQMPLEKTFFAERFGMVQDRFGTPWMVNFEQH